MYVPNTSLLIMLLDTLLFSFIMNFNNRFFQGESFKSNVTLIILCVVE